MRCSFFRSITNRSTSTPNIIAATANDARKVSRDTPSCFWAEPFWSSSSLLAGVTVALVVADEDVCEAEEVIERAVEAADERALDTTDERLPEGSALAGAVVLDIWT